MGIKGPASITFGAIVGGLIGVKIAVVALALVLLALGRVYGQSQAIAWIFPLLLAGVVLVPASAALGAIVGAGRAAEAQSRATPAPPDTWTVPDASEVEQVLDHHPHGPGPDLG